MLWSMGSDEVMHMNSGRSIGLAATLVCVAVALAGCKTVHTESFEGRDPGQVWTAMKAVAESPGYYDDWFVTANELAVYEDDQRIEIHRELARDNVMPGSGPQRERREMDQTISLVIDDDEGAEVEPIIKFVTAGPSIPVRDQSEAEMYFADVWELLGGRPPEADGDEERGDDAELIDIEDMD